MAIESFNYNANQARILFGPGGIKQLGEEVAQLGCQRALVLTKPGQAEIGDRALNYLGKRGCAVYTGAAEHTPLDVTEKAIAFVKKQDADCLVAVGGGSTIGLAKAIPQALYSLLQILEIPLSLREIGMPEDGLSRALELSFKQSYWNPRPLQEEPLRCLLENAFAGHKP